MSNKLSVLLEKHNELVRYTIFGVLTVIVNTLLYMLFCYIGLTDLFSNTMAFFIAVQFAYFANTKYVFKTNFTKENFLQFWGMRIGTIIIDNIGLLFLLNLGVGRFISKAVVNVVIIIMNYIFSKFFIYKKY